MTSNAVRTLDKTHGFLQDILNNQFERKVVEEESLEQKDNKDKRMKEYDALQQKKMEEEKLERRRRREMKLPTMKAYVPPSQRKNNLPPVKFTGRTIFEMRVEYQPTKFAALKVREEESIQRACELFASRHDISEDLIPPLQYHISYHMGLVNPQSHQ